MDEDTYELEQRACHQSRTSGVLAGAITAFIAFCAFELTGHPIAETATWMFALTLMAASGTFAVVYFVVRASLKKRTLTT
jgi:VIT1/CCC1 family predicted Fe2+/Mn2+ transporter